MNKGIIISAVIIAAATQIFSAEFILGEKFSKRNTAQTDTTTDSTELVRDSVFYMDSSEVAALEGERGQTMSGKRSRANVMRGIDQNASTVRKEYTNYLRQGNKLNGGIIVRFKVVPSGEVIDCKIVERTTDDIAFEKMVVLAVKKWKFSPVEIENDTTTIEHPFVFEQY